jgi:hypothetical protein
MEVYKYLFFKFYFWAYKLHGNKESNEYTAFFTLTFLVYINLMSIVEILILLFNLRFENIELSKLEIGVYSMIPVIPQYFILLYKKKYLRIVKKYYDNDKNRFGTLYVWLYILGSFFIFFFLVLLMIKRNESGI